MLNSSAFFIDAKPKLRTHVIIGASAAGIAAALKIRQLDAHAQIICICAETSIPYNKCLIADYVAGLITPGQLHLLSPEQAQEKNIVLMCGTRVVAIEAGEQRVLLSDGQSVFYDTLFIATGTSPIIPPIPGNNAVGVFTFHGMRDAQELIAFLQKRAARKAVVVGAGLSGLECADALRVRGIQVTVVERAPQLLSQHVTSTGSQFIQKRMESMGIAVYLGQSIVEICTKDHHVVGITLACGLTQATDLVVFAVGSRPNSACAIDASITTRDGHIIVDETMQTNISNVYAGGDVAMVRELLTGELIPSCTWPDAVQQGVVAAHAMVGIAKKYTGAIAGANSAFFGLKFSSVGRLWESGYERVEHYSEQCYKFFVLQNQLLCGFVVIGPTISTSSYKRALLTRQPIAKESLIQG